MTTANLLPLQPDTGDIVAVQADACDLPSSVTSERFDLVLSNSLNEHVGGHVPRQRLADNIHSLADRHWNSDAIPILPDRTALAVPGAAVAALRSGYRSRCAGTEPTFAPTPAKRRRHTSTRLTFSAFRRCAAISLIRKSGTSGSRMIESLVAVKA